MPRTNVFDPEGICQNCGRVEVSGAYCTYCLARPFEGILNPNAFDVASVRLALVSLHGWKAEALCYEITRNPLRVVADSAEAGMHRSAWPAAPMRPQRPPMVARTP